MRRASTPRHEFTLPLDTALVSKFLLTYAQNDNIILEKTKDNMDVSGNVWAVTLTQEEANLFSNGFAYAQIRVLTPGGQSYASDPMRFYVGEVFNDEVLI